MLFPEHVQRRYMRGKCLAFAVALKRETGLPIFVAIETLNGIEMWHHAFVVDESKKRAYDVRGAMDFTTDKVTAGMAATGAISMRRASMAEIARQMHVDPTLPEIQEARMLIRGVLANVYLEGRAERPEHTYQKAAA